MKVLVCGGRDFDDRSLFLKTMRPLRQQFTNPHDPCGRSAKCYMEIISGMARGADTLAVQYAEAFGLKLHKFPADWNANGRAAGPIRNQQMIDEGKPDLVVAFPGGVGTSDMIIRARKAGIDVLVVANAA